MIKNQMTGYASIDKPQNKGYSFSAKHPIIPNMSVYNSIKLINTLYQNKPAVNCHDLTASYRQLFDDAVTISRALKELGAKRGDIISVCMPNFYQAVATYLACNRIGATTTFLNYNAQNEEICDYLNTFESSIFINFDKTNEENQFIKDNSNVRYIVTLDKTKTNTLSLADNYRTTSNDTTIDFNSLGSIAKFQKKGLPTNSGKDNSLILFTSGTTGKPKSVVLTNENIVAAGTYLKNSSHVESLNGNSSLVCVPFSYPYGFVTSTIMTLLSSKEAILAPYISKETVSYYLEKDPNIIFGSPALLDLIMNNIPENQDLSSITTFISGGDFLTPSHSKRGKDFLEEHGAKDVEMGNGSGNAETVSCGTNPTGVEQRPETAGKILTGTSAMIVDPETMKELKYGEEGLLCVSGKHVFREYYNDPERTKEAKFERNGKVYFKTGTLGYIDEDGYFTLTGRDSRFYINASLNKIYPDKIQMLISYCKNIAACAVVEVPDEDDLCKSKAYIVLDDETLDPQEVIRNLELELQAPIKMLNGESCQLKKYEIPTYFEVISELPRKEGTDKVDYVKLEEDAEKKHTSNKTLRKYI